MRLIEIRLLKGPNLYRLEPVVKLEVAIGRRRTWYGKRDPEPYNLIRLGAAVPSSAQPARVAAIAAWVARLRRQHPDGAVGPVRVHQSSDPGAWIVTWPWLLGDRAREIAESAFGLVEREIPAARSAAPFTHSAWKSRLCRSTGRSGNIASNAARSGGSGQVHASHPRPITIPGAVGAAANAATRASASARLAAPTSDTSPWARAHASR